MKNATAHRITRLLTTAAVLIACSTSFAAETPALNEEQKTLYAIGATVARSLSVFNLTQTELELVLLGLNDSRSGKKPDFDVAAYNSKMQELARTRRKALGEKLAGAGKDFLEKAAKEKNAVKTASGLVYLPIVEGKGASPTATDVVKVNYRGTLIDGTEFDSSYKRKKPLEFKLNGVIPCWTEGVQKMKVGGKGRLVCPPNLAYGENGSGDQILPNATLDFVVELLEINPPAAAAPATTGKSTHDASHDKPAAPAKK